MFTARGEPWRKRLFDVVGAAGGLVAFSPVMAAITVAILLDDGRPILFRQERVGQARRPFDLVKFRSMRGHRITRVGRLLRATGLDELPQFVNILRGEMSAVGPRPLTESDIRRLGWDAARYDFRWRVRPGLTGFAQVIGATPIGDSGSVLRGAPEPVARRSPGGGVLCDQRARKSSRSTAPASRPSHLSWLDGQSEHLPLPLPLVGDAWNGCEIRWSQMKLGRQLINSCESWQSVT